MKTYWGLEVQLHPFLTSALDESEWSASYPGPLTSEERAPGEYCTGGWVGPRNGLNVVAKGKYLPLPGIEPRSSIP